MYCSVAVYSNNSSLSLFGLVLFGCSWPCSYKIKIESPPPPPAPLLTEFKGKCVIVCLYAVKVAGARWRLLFSLIFLSQQDSSCLCMTRCNNVLIAIISKANLPHGVFYVWACLFFHIFSFTFDVFAITQLRENLNLYFLRSTSLVGAKLN